MPFVPRTELEILRSLVARVLAYTGLTDFHEGGVAHELVAAMAKALARAELDLQVVADLGDLDRCVGEDLDARAAEALPDPLARTGAAPASATIRFSRSATDLVGDVVVPAGQVVARTDGTLYTTSTADTIPAGLVSSPGVTAVAQVAGTAGNCGVGAIGVLKSPPARVVACTNVTAATGGLDEESDASLRNRVRERCRALARVNPSALETGVRAYVGGLGQRVRFLLLDEAPPRADLWIDDGTGDLDTWDTVAAGELLVDSAAEGETVLHLARQAIRDVPTELKVTASGGMVSNRLLGSGDYTVEPAWGQIRLATGLAAGDQVETQTDYTAWTGLVAEVQRVVDGDPYDRTTSPGYRGTGTVVRVRPAAAALVSVAVDCLFRAGLSDSAVAAVRVAVADAVVSLVNGLEVGAPLYLAAIIDTVMEVDGVVNVRVTAPAADRYPAVHQVLRTVAGLVTVA